MAVDDARRRAELLAKQAGQSLGRVYSVTEFDFRGWQQSMLVPQRIVRESSIQTAGLRRTDIVGASPRFERVPLGPGPMTAQAKVYVAFLLGSNEQ